LTSTNFCVLFLFISPHYPRQKEITRAKTAAHIQSQNSTQNLYYLEVFCGTLK
jgi:hypothetical protein